MPKKVMCTVNSLRKNTDFTSKPGRTDKYSKKALLQEPSTIRKEGHSLCIIISDIYQEQVEIRGKSGKQ